MMMISLRLAQLFDGSLCRETPTVRRSTVDHLFAIAYYPAVTMEREQNEVKYGRKTCHMTNATNRCRGNELTSNKVDS